MITDFLTRIFTSRPVKLLLVLAVLTGIASQAAPMLVDTGPYVEKIATAVRGVTGATLMVKGGSTLQVLPRPALLLRDVEISQPGVARAPSVTADIAELGIDLFSLVTASPRIGSVRVAGVAAVAQKQDSLEAQWGFLGLPFLKSLAALKPGHTVTFELIGGSASVADAKTGETKGLSNLNAAGIFGEESRLSGTVSVGDTLVTFNATRSGALGATPVALSVDAQGIGSISLKGSMDFTADHPLVTGKLEAQAADIARMPGGTPAPGDPMPLKLSADYVQKEGMITLPSLTLDVLRSKAAGSLSINTAPGGSHRLALDFSAFDAADAHKLFALFKSRLAAQPDNHAPKTLFDKSLSMMVAFTADKVQSGAQSWGKAKLNGAIADGVLTINELSLVLPGESTVTLFGLVSVSDTQGLRFEGNTEASGKSLRDLLTVFDESASNLPSLGFGAYSLRSNLFVSSELMRLSEAEAKFSELSLRGGLVTYFDQRPRIESDVLLRDIDFDYFRNSWRANADPNSNTVFLRFDRNMNFEWLNKLGASIDFKVDVQGFNFLERKGKNASFRLFAQRGEFGIYNAKFNYDTDVTEANFKFDVTGAQPQLNLVLNTKELNTNYFALKPVAAIVKLPEAPLEETTEPLPDMMMPESTPEEELRRKIEEEAVEMGYDEVAATPAAAAPSPEPLAEAAPAEPVTLTPLITDNGDGTDTLTTITPQSLLIASAEAQEPPAGTGRWSQDLIDLTFLDGINGTFDISVGRLQHEDKVFDSFKMLAKLERNLLNFQTLTFIHWGGSFSINGTLFGGKVPGLSLGFIIASADLRQMLETLLGITSITGRTSLSGTIDTSGVNMLSWVEQANAKLLFAGRGVSIRGFDVASVLNAVAASRTAADVFNNVNLAVVGGAGEYSADGAINLQKAVVTTPGIALKTGRVVGNVSGDFRLIPWDINLTGQFKFPELTTENTPTLIVQWSGPVEHPTLQTDTQSLEAFVSKRITGN